MIAHPATLETLAWRVVAKRKGLFQEGIAWIADAYCLAASFRLRSLFKSQPVFYKAEKDRFKFTLFYYSQFLDDIPVFRAELRVLVRNESPFPVVLANSSLRPLGAFVVAGRAAQADPAAGIDSVKRVAPHLDHVIENGLVIGAGVDEQLTEPRLAYRIAAENAKPERWLYLVDARTGEIL